MSINIFLVVTASVLLLAGLAGTVIPILPGVPLAWGGLLVSHFSQITATPVWVLVVTGIIAVIITVIDSILQPYLTKLNGGSKYAVWGATIGLVISFFAGPLFVIIAPFIGAFIGEMIHDSSDSQRALKAAGGAFLGFMIGTGIKMICVFVYIWILIYEIVK
ncbi:MAG: DUF456 domain-containing protein [Treponema sp.]|nr:DUF456 domain-containing protein [Treponema sp.]